jgi:hypothetical protein
MSEYDYLENAAEKETITDSALDKLKELADEFQAKQFAVEQLEEKLRIAKEQFNQVSQQAIPELLNKYGLSEIRLANGHKIKIEQKISATIKDMPAFAQYLAERGDDGIIKSVAQLGKVEQAELDKIRRFCAELGLVVEFAQSVHPQTLSKYLREVTVVGDGDLNIAELPDRLSVYTFYKTTIK